MIKPIIDNIITNLQPLWFIDKIGGVVERKKLNVKGVEKVIPVTFNTDPACNNEGSTLIEYVPDQQYKTITYFERLGDFRTINSHKNWYELEGSVRLICWINWKKVNIEPDYQRLAANIIAAIPRRIANTEYLNAIRVQFAGEISRGADLFSNYTYDEKERQYLTHPYDAIGLDFTITFRLAPACAEELEPQEACG